MSFGQIFHPPSTYVLNYNHQRKCWIWSCVYSLIMPQAMTPNWWYLYSIKWIGRDFWLEDFLCSHSTGLDLYVSCLCISEWRGTKNTHLGLVAPTPCVTRTPTLSAIDIFIHAITYFLFILHPGHHIIATFQRNENVCLRLDTWNETW